MTINGIRLLHLHLCASSNPVITTCSNTQTSTRVLVSPDGWIDHIMEIISSVPLYCRVFRRVNIGVTIDRLHPTEAESSSEETPCQIIWREEFGIETNSTGVCNWDQDSVWCPERHSWWPRNKMEYIWGT